MDDKKKSSRLLHVRMLQNFFLVWLDDCVDEANNDDCRNTITQFQQVVNTVHRFTDVDECIDFVTDTKQEKAFIIISSALSRTIVPLIQDISQVSCIYILCEKKARHEQWTQQCSKVKGVFTDIVPICEALQQNAKECDQNMISISFVQTNDDTATQNLDQLDSSFMYTQIMKEILLTIDFKQEHIDEFVTYCGEQLADNNIGLKNVENFQIEYHHHQPIWWYTFDCFLCSMLNRALRVTEVDAIIKMGFFVRDLHQHIAALHAEQYGRRPHSDSLVVYRGQGLSPQDFDQLMKTKGGIMSFNNFLSTSRDRSISFLFADRNRYNSDMIGVLFEITINPSISSTTFADVKNVSAHEMEDEILFSMHSVFRIGQIQQIDGNNRLWQVNLTLTSDNDPLVHTLTESMREKTSRSTGWHRLGQLMLRLCQFNKAEELYGILLRQTTDANEKAYLFHQLGAVKTGKGDHAEAIEYYEKSIQFNQKVLPPTDLKLAPSYSSIGTVYFKMGEHSKALSYHEKALEIRQKTLSSNHPTLARSYNNIGMVYSAMSDYLKAVSFYEKALEIRQTILLPNHSHLATSYNNLGGVYSKMGEHLKALSYYEKTLEIRQAILPSNHPDLATSYNNLGGVYYKMGEHSKALSYFEKAFEIRQAILPSNHPDLATSYNNLGGVYSKMGEYSKALSYFEKALEIRQQTLPPNHPDLATSYNNIGGVYDNTGEHSKALSYYEKALEIFQKTLPPNHPHLAVSYNNIGLMYNNTGEYSKALSYYEKAFEYRQQTLPSNHPDLATSYNNIGTGYHSMGEYSKALSFLERAVDIGQRSLSVNHPTLQQFKTNLNMVKRKL